MCESAYLYYMGQHDGTQWAFPDYVHDATQRLNEVLKACKSVVGHTALLTKVSMVGGNESA